MVFAILIVVLSLIMDASTAFMGFKEAWGYSMSSYEGIQEITGESNDHRPWIWERVTYGAAIAASLLTGAFIGIRWDIALAAVALCASWGARYYAVHQWWYNWGLSHWKATYKRGLDESEHTTANKTTKPFKIRAYVYGWLIQIGLIIYLLWQ